MKTSTILAIALAELVIMLTRTSRAQAHAGEDLSSEWHMRGTLMPPFARAVVRNGERPWPYTGRVGLGVRAPNGIWAEGGGGATLGVEDVGWDVSLLGGGTVGAVAPNPGAWTVTVPVFFGYRFAKRAASYPTDAHSIFEHLHMMVVGARGAFTRWAEGGNGLELGLELSLSVPFARDEPTSDYYADGPTHTIIETGLYIAWLVEAP